MLAEDIYAAAVLGILFYANSQLDGAVGRNAEVGEHDSLVFEHVVHEHAVRRDLEAL